MTSEPFNCTVGFALLEMTELAVDWSQWIFVTTGPALKIQESSRFWCCVAPSLFQIKIAGHRVCLLEHYSVKGFYFHLLQLQQPSPYQLLQTRR